jgi:Zn-dependent peptidase ImmA (M78 family)
LPRPKKGRIFLEPPKLKWDFIRQKAEEFRRDYVNPIDLVPVPIIEIVVCDLGILPVPKSGLRRSIDADGFLTRDLKNICVDLDVYEDERQINRLRFTYAHEVGHLILHEKEIRLCDFRTSEDWIYFHEDFLEDDLNWFEQQAYEFAGRLLVPKEMLSAEIQKHQQKIDEFKSLIGGGEEELVEAISRLICDRFKVSPIVVQKRIRKEKINI